MSVRRGYTDSGSLNSLAAAMLLGITASLAVGCASDVHGQSSTATAAGGQGARRGGGEQVPVTTTTVVEKPMALTVQAAGTAEPVSTVQVRAQVTGQLLKVGFREGDEVREGQPLFTLDPRPFQIALDQATAALSRDSAQASNAQVEAARYQVLLQRGLIPRDQAEAQSAAAAALQGATAADQAAIAAARLNLQRTTIPAPVSGRTGALLAHPGDVVQADGASPLVVINQLAPIDVSFPVPGDLLDEVRHLQAAAPLKVAAVSRGAADQTSRAIGKVTFIDNTVDVTTGTIRLKAEFDNGDRALWPGEFTDVTLQLRTDPHALVLPAQAVLPGQQGSYVYIVGKDSVAQPRQVVVSRVQGQETVIASGVTAGETVVVDGQLRLSPGVKVVARPPVDSNAASEAAE